MHTITQLERDLDWLIDALIDAKAENDTGTVAALEARIKQKERELYEARLSYKGGKR